MTTLKRNLKSPIITTELVCSLTQVGGVSRRPVYLHSGEKASEFVIPKYSNMQT